MLSTGVPERQNLKLCSSNSVVQEVLCAIQEKPTDLDRAAGFDFCSQSWLLDEDCERFFYVFADRSRCRKPILRPPLRSLLDLALRARFDPIRKRHYQP